MRLIKWLDEHLEETLMIILLIIIACVTMIQVIVRKVPWLTSLTWAEEFCRFMWIWSVFISLPYTIRMENMLRVGVLVDLLPQAMKKDHWHHRRFNQYVLYGPVGILFL